MILNNWDKYRNTGLLVLRLGIGFMMLMHGMPKISGGSEKWVKLGSVMENIGMSAGFAFWGFMASFAEFGGGILLMLGLLYRPANLLLLLTMVFAAVMHFNNELEPSESHLMDASHSIELGILFLSLLLIGPGKFSLDYQIQKLTNENKKLL